MNSISDAYVHVAFYFPGFGYQPAFLVELRLLGKPTTELLFVTHQQRWLLVLPESSRLTGYMKQADTDEGIQWHRMTPLLDSINWRPLERLLYHVSWADLGQSGIAKVTDPNLLEPVEALLDQVLYDPRLDFIGGN